MYANVRGLKSKIACVKDVFSELKPDIALLTETHLAEDKGMRVEGYTYFGKSRKKGKGGGVGIFVKNEKKLIVAPHYTNRELEILWTSVNRTSSNPLFIGVYYGKQESTCNAQDIRKEMDSLGEEILEISREGEVILCMDANAKIGLMGEPMSRNGKLIDKVFTECQMEVMNGTGKCKGSVTRQNRKNQAEKSAIDLVAATYQASQWITGMVIDEIGDYRMRNKNESDHNTILIDVEVTKAKKYRQDKKTNWNLKASEEKFANFRQKLKELKRESEKIMANKQETLTNRYTKWEKLLYKAAITTVGKTTLKNKGPQKASEDIKRLRLERREKKNEFEKETSPSKKKTKMKEYVAKQHEIKEKILEEESKRMSKRFEKMKEERNNEGFWRERRLMNKDESSNWLITKDSHGNRIFDPELNKENIAKYYEELYSKQQSKHHPYHDEVKRGIEELVTNREETITEIDHCPTKAEIKDVINSKKNRKATSDWKNEIIKRGGNEMIDFVYPAIKAFWEEEECPKQWNTGIITNIWKGKGDRENMKNQRGITVSSAIGTIPEEVVFRRAAKVMNFTQAQAGGKKGASTADHVFTLRNIIALSKAEKRKIIITYFDVEKAYDRADTEDMMYSMSKSNVKGKIWRLTKALNTELTAKVNTKAGPTREITRETGGKQGGKLIVPLFAKMMDNVAEDMLQNDELGVKIGETKIPAFLFVDDLVTLAEGYEQQEKTLNAVDEFSIKHKLSWGQEKCNTMEIGNHKEEKSSWKLGEKEIVKCQSYKYLGEKISRDGKNDENINERCEKVKTTVRGITAFCKNEIVKRIGTKVILQLHEAETVPTLLYNSETWTLNASEKKTIDQIEIYAWKNMIGLPHTTPTAGIILTSGSLFASTRIETKQLLYLQKILKRGEDHWTTITLRLLKEKNIGWSKQINETLQRWELEEEWQIIQEKSIQEWKQEVIAAAERINLKKLEEHCEVKKRGETKQKTKTRFINNIIKDPSYERKPDKFILEHQSIVHARALIMGRYGMLQCGNNFANNYGGKICRDCSVTDDEQHRINNCLKWEGINLRGTIHRVAYDDIYSEDNDKVMKVVEVILSMWDLANGKNQMREL